MDYNGNLLPAQSRGSLVLTPFENQSADTPAPLMPKLFLEGPFPNPFGPIGRGSHYFLFQAHPLLLMDDGSVLQGLPGHMHEGVVPQPDAPASYAGNPNYPAASGLQPTPDLIAKGQCLAQYDFPKYNDPAFAADYTEPTAQGPLWRDRRL
jgi:hypothetical protein